MKPAKQTNQLKHWSEWAVLKQDVEATLKGVVSQRVEIKQAVNNLNHLYRGFFLGANNEKQ